MFGFELETRGRSIVRPKPIEKILRPRPPYRVSRSLISLEGVCLAGQMKLTSSNAEKELYYDILNTVGELCEEYIPHNYEGVLSSDLRRTIVNKAILRQPVLKRYEDTWPIPTMISMHRQLRKAGNQRGIMGRSIADSEAWASGHKKRAVRSARESQQKENCDSRGSSRKATPRNVATPRTRAISATLGTSQATMVGVVLRPYKPATAVESFLQGLPQDLRFLLPTFIQYGVKDEASLRGMLQMSEWRRWLYSWVKEGRLTELQFEMFQALGCIVDGSKEANFLRVVVMT
ncbi:hypothetical protein FKP32DRAFT_633788 [Trametes sanguinea]|nr:hypothetical protein FKP32DRAFT_633788 [Trametes sanguinea]